MASLGMNTGTGARNTPAPTVGIGRESMLEKLRNNRDVRNINHQLKQFNDNYNIDKMRQRMAEDEARFDAYGERAFNVRHNAQKDLNEQTAGHNREAAQMQMQDNNVQRSYTSMDKWNELQSSGQQNAENNKTELEKARLQYQAQAEANKVSRENAILSSYSNLYANLATPKGDFRYW